MGVGGGVWEGGGREGLGGGCGGGVGGNCRGVAGPLRVSLGRNKPRKWPLAQALAAQRSCGHAPCAAGEPRTRAPRTAHAAYTCCRPRRPLHGMPPTYGRPRPALHGILGKVDQQQGHHVGPEGGCRWNRRPGMGVGGGEWERGEGTACSGGAASHVGSRWAAQ